MGAEVIQNDRRYLYIINGTLTEKSEEGKPDAKLRKYEDSKGNKGEKWEISYKNLNGHIANMFFKDSDFGEQFILVLDDGGEKKWQVQMSTDSRYFTDFAKKVSNIHLDMDVTINPYSIQKENSDKYNRGISIKQEGQKVENYFWDGKETVNGLPRPEGDTSKYSKDDWKMFFLKEKKFLKEHILSIDLELESVNVDDVEDMPVEAEQVPASSGGIEKDF